MALLVLNGGSSSLKFSVFERGETPRILADGEVTGVGGSAQREFQSGDAPPATEDVQAATLRDALNVALASVRAATLPAIEAVGYRVVHPGQTLHGHQRVTPDVLRALDAAAQFAPLHDPPTVEIIRLGMEQYPEIPHFVCFDTEFHRTMPAEAYTYALPKEQRDRGVRRYGFHGLSCESIVYQLQNQTPPRPIPARMAIAHLGSGCSITTLLAGKSIDNTMGLTPDGGVVMGTRPGDLDPGVVLYLLREAAKTKTVAQDAGDVERMLNQSAGLVALSGLANDMRVLRKAAAAANAEAILALFVFTRSVRKALGAAAFILGGLDAIVFTGGIGEHDAATRAEVLAGLEALGIAVDLKRNIAAPHQADPVRDITASNQKDVHAGNTTAILILPALEDLMIARHVDRLLNGRA